MSTLTVDNKFRRNWLVEDTKTGRQFATLNLYRPSDFVEDGNLRPLRPATSEEVTARMAGQS